MNKAKVNLIIDGIMFLLIMALTGTGYIRKYILLSGSTSRRLYGEKLHMTFLGINREGWSEIHLILGYILIGLVFLHIILHWKQIKSIYNKLIPNPNVRKIVTAFFIVTSILLLLLPFILQPTIIKITP